MAENSFAIRLEEIKNELMRLHNPNAFKNGNDVYTFYSDGSIRHHPGSNKSATSSFQMRPPIHNGLIFFKLPYHCYTGSSLTEVMIEDVSEDSGDTFYKIWNRLVEICGLGEYTKAYHSFYPDVWSYYIANMKK